MASGNVVIDQRKMLLNGSVESVNRCLLGAIRANLNAKDCFKNLVIVVLIAIGHLERFFTLAINVGESSWLGIIAFHSCIPKTIKARIFFQLAMFAMVTNLTWYSKHLMR